MQLQTVLKRQDADQAVFADPMEFNNNQGRSPNDQSTYMHSDTSKMLNKDRKSDIDINPQAQMHHVHPMYGSTSSPQNTNIGYGLRQSMQAMPPIKQSNINNSPRRAAI